MQALCPLVDYLRSASIPLCSSNSHHIGGGTGLKSLCTFDIAYMKINFTQPSSLVGLLGFIAAANRDLGLKCKALHNL